MTSLADICEMHAHFSALVDLSKLFSRMSSLTTRLNLGEDELYHEGRWNYERSDINI